MMAQMDAGTCAKGVLVEGESRGAFFFCDDPDEFEEVLEVQIQARRDDVEVYCWRVDKNVRSILQKNSLESNHRHRGEGERGADYIPRQL